MPRPAIRSGRSGVGAAAGALSSAPAGAVTVGAGSSIQAAVDAAAANAVFWIGPGVHREQAVSPKAGQKFFAAPGCVLNGARLLASFATETVNAVAYNVASGLSAMPINGGALCLAGHRCQRSEMLFVDGVPCKHETSLANVQAAGSFFFDEAQGKVYFRESTAGKTIEFTQASYAFRWTSGAAGVAVQGFTVEKYASPPQSGAILGGPGWLVSRNTVRLCYGVGVSIGNGSTVERNLITNNGQMGYGNGHDGGTPLTGQKLIGNEVSHNGGWSGVHPDWEAGGGKITSCSDAVLRGNYVHHNAWCGMWTDIDVVDALIEHNRVEFNHRAGIVHEISYAATIRRNRCVGNGNDAGMNGWLWNGQIQIQNSEGCTVSENYVDARGSLYGHGVALIYQDRTGAPRNAGRYQTQNNTVAGNDIVTGTQDYGVSGGVWDYADGGAAFSSNAMNNRFTGNRYRVPTPDAAGPWWFAGTFPTFAAWRSSFGFDIAGSVDADLTSPYGGAAAASWMHVGKFAFSPDFLTATGVSSGVHLVRAGTRRSTGKWYFEITVSGTFAAVNTAIGLCNAATTPAHVAFAATEGAYIYRSGEIYVAGGSPLAALGALPSGARIDVAYDMDAKRAWFRSNGGGWNGSGTADPAANTGGLDLAAVASTGLSPCFVTVNTTDSVTANFGGSPFAGAVPAGFAAPPRGLQSRVFHVDNAGSDAADGLTPATAWATAAKVNGEALLAGDSVLFKRGGVWRETLAVPRGDLRIGSYGAGARPVFNGADLRASWTPEARPARENFLDGAGPTPHSHWTLSETGGDRVDGKAAANNDLTPGGTNPVGRVAGPLSTVPFAAAFDGTNWLGATPASLSAGFPGKNTATSMTVGCWVNALSVDGAIMAFTLGWGITYVVGRVYGVVWDGNGTLYQAIADQPGDGQGHWAHVALRWVQGGELALFINGAKQTTTAAPPSMLGGGTDLRIGRHDFWGGITGSIAEPFMFDAALTDAQIADIATVGLGGRAAGNIHHSPQTYYPEGQVFRDGARLALARSKKALEAGQHWYDDQNGRLYVCDDPAGAAMEVSARQGCVVATGKSAVSISGIAVDKALRHGFDISRGSSAVTVHDCEMTLCGQHGYAALTRAGDPAMPGLVVGDSTATGNGDCGIIAGPNTPGWRASACTAHHNGGNPEAGAVTGNIVYTSRGLVGPRLDGYVAPPPGAVPLALNADLQAAIDANPAGTAFALAAGTWTGKFDIRPKAGNKFFGAKPAVPGEIATTIDGGGTTTQRFINGLLLGGIVLANLRVRNYRNLQEGGQLGCNAESTDWLIENCEFTRNTIGIVPGTRMLLRDSRLTYNGITGASGGGAHDGAVFAHCDVSWNNQDREAYNPEFAHACGVKIVPDALNFTFRCNRVHHNVGANISGGTGFWLDIGCTGSLVEGNTVTDHGNAGIVVELDHATELRDNYLARNCNDLRNTDAAWFYKGQLQITNSSNGEYHHNDFVGVGGVWAVELDRTAEGPYFTEDNAVHDNLTFAERGRVGFVGTIAGVGDGNVWTRNAYRFAPTAKFETGDALSPTDFAGWQALGQDPYSGGAGGVLLPYAPVHTAARGVLPVAAAGVVIEDCGSWSAGYSVADAAAAHGGSTGNGIWLDGAGAGSTVRRCRSFGCVGAGLRISDLGPASGVVVERNVVAGSGAGIAAHGSWGGATIARNTLYANQHNLWLSGQFGGETAGTAGNQVRDNIAYLGGIANLTVAFGADNTGAGSGGNTYAKNALGTPSAGFAVWGWGNGVASYAALDAASGQTQGNVSGDPLFTDPGAGNFTLQAGSPCLGAGTGGENIGAF